MSPSDDITEPYPAATVAVAVVVAAGTSVLVSPLVVYGVEITTRLAARARYLWHRARACVVGKVQPVVAVVCTTVVKLVPKLASAVVAVVVVTAAVRNSMVVAVVAAAADNIDAVAVAVAAADNIDAAVVAGGGMVAVASPIVE